MTDEQSEYIDERESELAEIRSRIYRLINRYRRSSGVHAEIAGNLLANAYATLQAIDGVLLAKMAEANTEGGERD